MAANFQSVFFLLISDPAKWSALCAIAQLLWEAGFNHLPVSGVSPLISSPSEIHPLCLISHANGLGAPLQSCFPLFNHPAWVLMSMIVVSTDGQFSWPPCRSREDVSAMGMRVRNSLRQGEVFHFSPTCYETKAAGSFLPLAFYGNAQTLWACTGNRATLESQGSKEHFAPTASQMSGQIEAPIRQSLSWPIKQTLPRSFSHWISYFRCWDSLLWEIAAADWLF